MPEGFVARVDPANLHTAIRVNDLDAALRFYHDDVGLPILRTSGPPERPSAVFVPGVQLIRATEPIAASTPGAFDHVGIPVENLEDVCARLGQRGHVPETPLETRPLPDGSQVTLTFYRDPDGNRVELFRRG